MLNVKQAKDFFLIVGPPGTGKTSFGMLNTLKEELLEPDSSVLLLSYTNRAVDEICGKLLRDGIDFIRVGGALTCSEECRPNLLESKVSGITNKDELCRLLKSARVYAGTTSAINAHSEIFRLKQFTLAIVDEASQILEPHIIGLLSAQVDGSPAIGKFVFIGDHKQLPAVVQQTEEESAVSNPLLHAIGLTDCRLSLFERLYRRHKDDPRVCQMLTTHGRMHEDIARFPNASFYQNRLRTVPLPHQAEAMPPFDGAVSVDGLVDSHRVAFVDVQGPEQLLSDRVNLAEAAVIARIAVSAYRRYSSCFDPNETLGIIVPYRNQIAAVRNAIAEYGIPELTAISIDTVERYQGSQRKVIIYGFTIQQRHQLNFLCSQTFVEDGSLIDRKLNVVMTRAMERLYLVGNSAVISESPVFRSLIEYVKGVGGYLDTI
jgi:superfamily I DNA and/or RNA helicase